MYRKSCAAVLAVFLFATAAMAQRAEVTVTVNEVFFDALLDSMYANFEAPKFSIRAESTSGCDESIKILREVDGVRTGVRLRGGVIALPLAFSGKYSLPFVGCVDYSGTADSVINIEFDRASQRITGRVTVNAVNLSGTNGVGGSVVAKLLRSTIDKKLNPIEIVSLEKLSFGIPVQNGGNLKMRAVGVVTEVVPGSLNVRIAYEFVKG